MTALAIACGFALLLWCVCRASGDRERAYEALARDARGDA